MPMKPTLCHKRLCYRRDTAGTYIMNLFLKLDDYGHNKGKKLKYFSNTALGKVHFQI